jgi:hypothetical protein
MEPIAHCTMSQSALPAPTIVAMNEKAVTAFMKMNAVNERHYIFVCA